jgi:GNAT superfamily N-acetyltransferase
MSSLSIRSAQPGDEHALFGLIRALAVYEKLEGQVTGSPELLAEHLFGPRPACEVLIALEGAEPVGYALFFGTYSTFLTQPGIYLEDLFVLEARRGRGIGRALFQRVAARAVEQGAGRLEWSVLDWNTRAIHFYERLGAVVLDDWSMFRLSAGALASFAGREFT